MVKPVEDRLLSLSLGPQAGAPGASIGRLLVDSGKLGADDAERVLRYARDNGLRFGEAAVQLGLVTEQDIRAALSLQFDYPCLAPGEGGFSAELVSAFAPATPMVEALRALRTQLMLRWFGPEPEQKALAVVSPARGEGRSYVAANLAVVFSQLGGRTLLIDADLRHPRQHAIFNLGNRSGLSAILAGRAGLDAIEAVPNFVGLSVLPAGAVPPNPQELLGRPAFSRLLETAAQAYDVILLDTPAAAGSADAQTVSIRAGGSLLVTRRHHTRVSDAQSLVRHIVGASGTVVGSVLNDF